MTDTPARNPMDYLTRALAADTPPEGQPLRAVRALVEQHGADAVRNALAAVDPCHGIDFTGLPQARATDPSTSHAAAADERRQIRAAGQVAELLLAYHQQDGHGDLYDFTAEEACTWVHAYTDVVPSWRRVSDLRRLGLIEPTGEIRKTDADLDAEVMRITEHGQAVARRLRAARAGGRKSIRLDV